MSNFKELGDIISKVEDVTKKPEKFLSVQEEKCEEIKVLTKEIYDYGKKRENPQKSCKDALKALIIQDFDEEQIWQEIDLQNKGVCNNFIKDVAHLLAKKEKLLFSIASSDCSKTDKINAELSSLKDDESEIDSENGESHFDGAGADNQIVDQSNQGHGSDDDDDDTEDSIDYFTDDSGGSKDKEPIYYKDFFDEPDEGGGFKRRRFEEEMMDDDDNDNDGDNDDNDSSKKEKKKRKVTFMLGDEGFSNKLNKEHENEEPGKSIKNDEVKSSFQTRQERLKARIDKLEEEALKEKPWQMKGEIIANLRPENSLLQEYVEFDVASRPAPVITEKTTLKLEDIIKQRMKDMVWDDVVRKIKAIEDPREYKKRLVLDQEKSKLSLAEIYEQEYIKQRESKTENITEKPDEEPPEHIEIRKLLSGLFSKLDALSNFHYTPKQVAADIKIITNLPAISIEEVAPTATSDAMLLAPEEVKSNLRKELKGKNERTATEKKHERRQKKLKQKLRQKEKERKEKLVNKLNPGLGNKYSKEKAKKILEKAVRDPNVSQMDEKESEGKYVKSSNAFFSKLQNEVTSHVKRNVSATKNLKSEKKFNAKKLKM